MFLTFLCFIFTSLLHLQLQSGEQIRLALPHLQLEQFPVQEHFYELTTCSRLLWNCYPYWDPRFQLLGPSKFLRRGNHLLCLCTHSPYSSRTCWSSASCMGGIRSTDRFFRQKSSSRTSLTVLRGLVLSYIVHRMHQQG